MEENPFENRLDMMDTGSDDRAYWLWHAGITFVIIGGSVLIFVLLEVYGKFNLFP